MEILERVQSALLRYCDTSTVEEAIDEIKNGKQTTTMVSTKLLWRQPL